MRNGMATIVLVALIGLLSSIVTVVFEKESDGIITKTMYQETNKTTQCEKIFPKIIFTDE